MKSSTDILIDWVTEFFQDEYPDKNVSAASVRDSVRSYEDGNVIFDQDGRKNLGLAEAAVGLAISVLGAFLYDVSKLGAKKAIELWKGEKGQDAVEEISDDENRKVVEAAIRFATETKGAETKQIATETPILDLGEDQRAE